MSSVAFAPIAKPERKFLSADFTVTTWDELQPYFENLKNRKLENKDELEQWLKDVSELEAVISEDASWRQIRMTCDTTNSELEEAFTYFVTEIEPKMKPYFFELNKKLLDNAYYVKYYPVKRQPGRNGAGNPGNKDRHGI